MFIANTGKHQSSLNPIDQTPFTISRNQTIVESMQTFINDGSTVFHYNNDEAQGHIRFVIDNSDTESGGGANANSTEILTLKASNTESLTTINSVNVENGIYSGPATNTTGANTHIMWKTLLELQAV